MDSNGERDTGAASERGETRKTLELDGAGRLLNAAWMNAKQRQFLVFCLLFFLLPVRGLDRTGTLWTPCLEWSIENPSYSGNPFDLEATATFHHTASGDRVATPMFYDGNNVWKFRFTGVRTGEWTFRTTSADSDLAGHEGRVVIRENPDAGARGFIMARDRRFVRQGGEEGAYEAFIPNVWMNYRRFGDPARCGWTDMASSFEKPETVAAYLDEAEAHGCNGIQALVANQWFQINTASSRDHQNENPDPATFRALEQAIVQAHQRGMFVQIWKWGDEQRGWTPVRVGGINGAPDRRVQRYIAARLGPLPGWIISYGFDLDEWVTTDQARQWAEYLRNQSGWKPLLGARQHGAFQSPPTLDFLAQDDRPASGFYQNALAWFDEAGQRPVFFERRFSYLRDNVWDMETTRRAFWQFALAGGAGSIWGHYPPDCSAYVEGSYPHPEQLRTHRQFWQSRFLLEMRPANELSADADTLVLGDPGGRAIFYREESDSIGMRLDFLERAAPAIAVDVRKAYEEIAIGPVDPGDRTWKAPYRSDWAVVVGVFE
jgi:hypothetical protein